MLPSFYNTALYTAVLGLFSESPKNNLCQIVILKFYKCNLLIFAVNDQKLALIESKVDQCAAQNDLMLLENNFSRKSDEFNQMFSNMNEQLKSVDKLATEFDTDVIETVKKNTQRIDRMEIADRKNNLIIKG